VTSGTDTPHPASLRSDDLDFAFELAAAADRITLDRFQALDLRMEYKTDGTEVTDADRETERTLRGLVRDRRPTDAVLGEEYGGEPAPGRQWIFDPIDGTANYLRGVPVWATLIGLCIDGLPVLGVVSAPALDRRWWAQRGAGASASWQGRERTLAVSDVDDLARAFISYASLHYWEEDGGTAAPALALSRAAWRDRSFGDFWPYMMVAEGTMDVACEPGLHPYDMAALHPIVTEAGGAFTGLDGTGTIWEGDALATNARLHPAAVSILQEGAR
jgi:histidinol-phosphatase